MATLISHKTESDSLSPETHKPKYKSVIVRYQYEPVNIYDIQSEPRETNKFTSMMSVCFQKLCCCRSLPEDDHDSPIGDPNSSLVGPIRKSYTLNNQCRTTLQSAPTIILSRPLDDESSTSTLSKPDSITSSATKIVDNESVKSTTVLVMAERKECSSSETEVKECDPKEIDASSRGSTLRSGEKMSFIRDVLSCRDTFLKSMEWFDNSLTRGKRCRPVKTDEWLELQNEGTSALRHYCARTDPLLHITTLLIFKTLLSFKRRTAKTFLC